MAVTYQTEGVKMPDIKKRETTEWIKNVAASYGKRLGEIAYIFYQFLVVVVGAASRAAGHADRFISDREEEIEQVRINLIQQIKACQRFFLKHASVPCASFPFGDHMQPERNIGLLGGSS